MSGPGYHILRPGGSEEDGLAANVLRLVDEAAVVAEAERAAGLGYNDVPAAVNALNSVTRGRVAVVCRLYAATYQFWSTLRAAGTDAPIEVLRAAAEEAANATLLYEDTTAAYRKLVETYPQHIDDNLEKWDRMITATLNLAAQVYEDIQQDPNNPTLEQLRDGDDDW